MEKMATRDAYGRTLVELGKERDDIVVLDADLSGSTRTGWFAKEFPERFFNVGVAEQNLVGISAGLALSGVTPFCSSFAMFLSGRAWEIIRNSVAYPNLNVKLVASHAGITVGEDGASHQCIEDIATMRAIPNMRVFVPSDGIETAQIIRAISQIDGPCYVRCGRSSVPVFHTPDYKFEIGKGELIASGTDVTIISCGVTTAEAIEAQKQLKSEGISAGLINMASIKPIDAQLLLQEARKSSLFVTIEEHNVLGGLGAAVAEVTSAEHPIKVVRMGMQDEFGKSGTADALLDHFKLRAADIVATVKSHLSK